MTVATRSTPRAFRAWDGTRPSRSKRAWSAPSPGSSSTRSGGDHSNPASSGSSTSGITNRPRLPGEPVTKYLTTQARWPRVGVVLVVTLIACAAVISRRQDAFTNAQFWAEDGSKWFVDAYRNGPLGALDLSFMGYFQTVSRLGPVAAAPFGVVYAPLIYNIVGLIVQIAPVPYFLSSRFELGGAVFHGSPRGVRRLHPHALHRAECGRDDSAISPGCARVPRDRCGGTETLVFEGVRHRDRGAVRTLGTLRVPSRADRPRLVDRAPAPIHRSPLRGARGDDSDPTLRRADIATIPRNAWSEPAQPGFDRARIASSWRVSSPRKVGLTWCSRVRHTAHSSADSSACSRYLSSFSRRCAPHTS